MDSTVRELKTPTYDDIVPHLKALGIGKDTPVVCYDYLDGDMACRGAFILAFFGVKTVKVLDCKFGSWNARSETELKKPDITLSTRIDFVANKEWIA